MIIFRVLLFFAALSLLSAVAVAEVFDTETNPPSSSKSAKSSNGDDDIDFDAVVNLVEAVGGVQNVIPIVRFYSFGDGEEEEEEEEEDDTS